MITKKGLCFAIILLKIRGNDILHANRTTKWLKVNSHRFTPWNNSFAIQQGEPVVKKKKSISKTPKEFNKSK